MGEILFVRFLGRIRLLFFFNSILYVIGGFFVLRILGSGIVGIYISG
jgi:hypothetical protein